MKADLEDALIPVKWAEAQMPILQQRLIDWQRTYPYQVVPEADPDRSDRELLVAYLDKPLDPRIIGDVGAMINSIRTGLDLLLTAVIARHGIVPDYTPNFPIHETPDKFLTAVKKLETEYRLSSTEIAVIKRTKAYSDTFPGGDHLLWHIAKLDNLRKHRRLLTVEPIPSDAFFTAPGYGFEKVMTHMEDKSILFRIPRGAFSPHKGNTNVTAEIFLFETPAGIGDHEALLALRVYIARVKALIQSFP